MSRDFGRAVAGIAEIINCPGLVNVDFEDVRTVMSEMGMAMMGSAFASGVDRARLAAEQAVASPLLEGVNLSGARGVLVNITASESLKMREVNEVMNTVRGFAADEPPKNDESKKEEPKKAEKKAQFQPGTYAGTFTASGPNFVNEGEITMTLDENGKFTGEFFDKTQNIKYIFKGARLKDNKSISVSDTPDGQKSSSFGTISPTANGGWTGTLINRRGTNAVAFIEYEVSPKPK